ncbi:hypothetical protein Hamer_G024969 [Homarus americanus]|uniref:Peptidase A2 domain-containing protein n=1 Tax=Homarus americanus TaxID=6706 RepID=A0A8J5JRM0_HOMAM|nr:hypothetical protein Hamer_G024969 [Homarus americanus]
MKIEFKQAKRENYSQSEKLTDYAEKIIQRTPYIPCARTIAPVATAPIKVKKETGTKPKQNTVCKICKKQNHRTEDCFYAPQDGNTYQFNKAKRSNFKNQNQKLNPNAVSKTYNASETKTSLIAALSKVEVLTIPVSAGNTKLSLDIDTGACVNVISLTSFTELNRRSPDNKWQIRPTDVDLSGVSGQHLDIMGVITLPIGFCDSSEIFLAEFYVVKDFSLPADGLLVQFLGHVVDGNGIHTMDCKVKAVEQM